MTIIENVQNSWNVESVGVLRYWISRISYTPSRNVTVSSVSCWVVGASKRKTTPKHFPLQEAAESAYSDVQPDTTGTRAHCVPVVSGRTSDTSTLVLAVLVKIAIFGFILSVLGKGILVVTLSLIILYSENVRHCGVSLSKHVGKLYYVWHVVCQ